MKPCNRLIRLGLGLSLGLSLSLGMLLGPTAVRAGKTTNQHSSPMPDMQAIWYDGDRERRFILSQDQLGVWFDPAPPAVSGEDGIPLNVTEQLPDTALISLSERIGLLHSSHLVRSNDPRLGRVAFGSRTGWVDHVFRASADQRAAPYLLTGEMIVHFVQPTEAGVAERWGQSYHVDMVRSLAHDNAYLFTCPTGLDCLELTVRARNDGAIRYAYPNWIRPHVTRSDDPRYPDQWHLNNTGQRGGIVGADANLEPAWNAGWSGTGVTIAIVDDGVQIAHEDLSDNVIPGSHDYIDGDDDPSPTGDRDHHGTACAGVAAARGYNNIGVRGSAPLGNLLGYRLLDAKTDINEADALARNAQIVDISSNSWGPPDVGFLLAGPSALTQAALHEGVTQGRGGKGLIYVWAGGNGLGYDDNSNYDGYANSLFTIAVAASTDAGRQSWYSEPGANILVNAPSNGGAAGITTTDRMGAVGYTDGNYTDSFGGTSSATPLVSGAIALALEANPALTWRDIKQLLAKTAFQNDPSDTDWTTNAAGLNINHKYGYGRIDAAALVTAAQTWTLLPTALRQIVKRSAPSTPIPDGVGEQGACGDPAVSTLEVTEDLNIEFVALWFQSAHPFWGDLDIRLTSPSGTESVLAETHDIENDYDIPYDAYAAGWSFGIERLIDEPSQGTWTLSVRDCWSKDTGRIDAWQLEIFGTDPGSTGQSCEPDDIVLTTSFALGVPAFASETSIRSQGHVQVAAGAGLTLTAPRIVLEPGFAVAAGGTLDVTAQTVSCPG